MSELITETILPGTYIEVRAEGLLGVGAIATGNVGIVGTAEKGDDAVHLISSAEQAQAIFGRPGEWIPGGGLGNLTLVRAISLAFSNGASTVYARRAVHITTGAETDQAQRAQAVMNDDAGGGLLTLTASSEGTWGNAVEVSVTAATEAARVEREILSPAGGTFAVSAAAGGGGFLPDNAPPKLGLVTVAHEGRLLRYPLVADGSSGIQGAVHMNTLNGALTFPAPPPPGAEVRASYPVRADRLRQVILETSSSREVYIVASGLHLLQLMNDEDSGSRLVVGAKVGAGLGVPALTAAPVALSGGANGRIDLGSFRDALDDLSEKNIQLLTVVGPEFDMIQGTLLAHLEQTENLGQERIALVGAEKDDVDTVLENANSVADKRLVLVAPGMQARNPSTGRLVDLPSCFTAAAVTGRLAGVPPQASLTNKSLRAVDGLTKEYRRGDLKALVLNRVLAVEDRRGFRVVKAISTDDGAYKQITLRRIVDYVKQGTRLGANQYIGKLNNKRVRGNLFTTLDSFLSQLVADELLVDKKLEVFADRAMEIRGEVRVTMDLWPTFSIDVVRVVMNLQ